MTKASIRLRRKNPILDKYSLIFADSIHEGNHERSAAIALMAALEFNGPEGIVRIIEKVNRKLSFPESSNCY